MPHDEHPGLRPWRVKLHQVRKRRPRQRTYLLCPRLLLEPGRGVGHTVRAPVWNGACLELQYGTWRQIV